MKAVLIDSGVLTDENSIDDIVSIHDDDVELGPAYSTFKIIDIPGMTTSEFRETLIPLMDSESDAPFNLSLTEEEIISLRDNPEMRLSLLNQKLTISPIKKIKG